MKNSIKVALVQKKPVHLNLEKSLKKAKTYIAEAADKGAELVVFGETWLTGYPAWIDYSQGVAQWGNADVKELYSLIHANAIDTESKEMMDLMAQIRKCKVNVVMGANEKVSSGPGNGTVYNSLFIFGPNGELINHHRKLMPTFNEKLFYGLGDGAGLQAVDTSFGRLGGLICWEHWMPLTRQAMHDSGELIHVSAWPSVNDLHKMASRHYAFEGRCFVISVGQVMQVKDVPKIIRDTMPSFLLQDHYLLNGGSCIIGPDGEFILRPKYEKEEIIIHEIDDIDKALRENITMDVSGHYSRRDVFDLKINKDRK